MPYRILFNHVTRTVCPHDKHIGITRHPLFDHMMHNIFDMILQYCKAVILQNCDSVILQFCDSVILGFRHFLAD